MAAPDIQAEPTAAVPSTATPASLASRLKHAAVEIGFDLVGISAAVAPDGLSRLREWLAAGNAGEMAYIQRRLDAYADPARVLPEVRSVVMLATNYRTRDPLPLPAGAGRVSRYAWGERDYHDVLRERTRRLADVLHAERPDCRTRCIVDSAPLLERDFARRAGLGWFGKNTMLINKRLGSWFFLSALLTDVELPPDAPHDTAHCGTCTRCLEACPTDAFDAPGRLDARKCISYLTIELRGRPIPESLRSPLGDWAFGCDVCQDVCPWNTKAPVSGDPAFAPAAERDRVDLADLLSLTDEEFATRHRGTPLERPGRDGLLQNACIVAGNTGGPDALPLLERAARESSSAVREAAAWAERELRRRHADCAADAGFETHDVSRPGPTDVTAGLPSPGIGNGD
ncbi:MAG: tRNA epoxyqueuosine(34) reductase QueG [Planctomyces sp.]|nr:tRNA epoxyqueuosine(34) reductase QueG [Planctomyces sp.]